MLSAAITSEPKFLHGLPFCCDRDTRSIHVGRARSICISHLLIQFRHAPLKPAPHICKDAAAIHTTNRNNHSLCYGTRDSWASNLMRPRRANNRLGQSRMTSVLFNAGLNYQNGNPVRLGIEANRSDITELRKLLDVHTTEITLLKARLAVAEKEAKEAKAAAAAAAATTAPPPASTTS